MSQKKRSLFWLTVAAGLMFIGIITITFTIADVIRYELHGAGQPVWWQDQTELLEQNSTSYTGSGEVPVRPYVMSILMLVGSSMTAAGLFIFLKRYSLRSLLAFVLITGALGLVPLQLPKRGPARLHVKLRFSKNLPSGQIALINERLQPDVALATLPAGVLKRLRLPPGGGIGKVEVTACEKGVEMLVTACPGLEGEQCDTVMEFYSYYFKLLVFETAKAEGLSGPWDPHDGSFTGQEGQTWIDEWEQARQKKKGTITPSP